MKERYKIISLTVTTTRKDGMKILYHEVDRTDLEDPLRISDKYIARIKQFHESVFGAREDRKSLVTKIDVKTTGD